MSGSVVQQVEGWYAEHSASLSRATVQLWIQSMKPTAAEGKVAIGMETSTVLASLTFWNQGDVEVILVDKRSRGEQILDDRKLGSGDDIPSLLDGYVRRISSLTI